MSLVSIYTNKNIISDKIEELRNMNFDSTATLSSYVMSKCLLGQYDMMRSVLNKNMLKKRHFDPELKGSELLNSLYQHIYSHNYIALQDEIYEIHDAVKKLNNKLDVCTEEPLMELLLVIEEYIDAFHFILEYTALLEEHYMLSLAAEESIIVENLNYYYTEDNTFAKNVKEMLKNEGSHIISYLLDDNLLLGNIDKTDADYLDEMARVNRDFIRSCNFKDWKNYPDDYYSKFKFGELFELNRKLYISVITGLSEYINVIGYLIDINFNPNNLKDVMTVIYGLYMAKREENIRRQNNDPRYTGKKEGEIVGIKVS